MMSFFSRTAATLAVAVAFVWTVSAQPPKPPVSGVTLARHDGAVVFAGYLPDAKSLVTITYEGAIRKWDSSTGKELQQIERAMQPDGSTPDVRCRTAAISPTGRFLGVLTYESILNVYDLTTGKRYGQLATGDDQLSGAFGVTFSPDGKSVVTGRFHGRGITQWDLATGKAMRTFGDDAKPKAGVVFGRSALHIGPSTIVGEVGTYSNNQVSGIVVKRWDLATGKELGSVRGPGTDYGSVVFAPDARTAAWNQSATRDIHLWDLTKDRELRKFEGTGQAQAFSPDGKVLAGHDADRVLCLWNVDTGKLLRKFGEKPSNPPLNARANVAAFSSDGKKVVNASGNEVHQWDIGTGKEIGSASSRR